MPTQLEIKQSEQSLARSAALVRVLEYGLVGALQNMGMELRGIAIRYDPFNVLLTIKVDAEGSWFVAHVGSDSISNCFLKAGAEASRNALRWKPDRYQPNDA